MKLLQAISVVVLVFCTLVYAFQRTADWGYQPEQSNEKAEFAWSRLSFTSSMASYGGGGYGPFVYGRGGSRSRDDPQAERPVLVGRGGVPGGKADTMGQGVDRECVDSVNDSRG